MQWRVRAERIRPAQVVGGGQSRCERGGSGRLLLVASHCERSERTRHGRSPIARLGLQEGPKIRRQATVRHR